MNRSRNMPPHNTPSEFSCWTTSVCLILTRHGQCESTCGRLCSDHYDRTASKTTTNRTVLTLIATVLELNGMELVGLNLKEVESTVATSWSWGISPPIISQSKRRVTRSSMFLVQFQITHTNSLSCRSQQCARPVTGGQAWNPASGLNVSLTSL